MVEKSGFYYPDSVVVKNEAIKAESVSVKIRQDTISEAQPEYKVVHYEGKEEHVRWSETDTDGAPMLQITSQQEEYIISEVPDTEPEGDAYLSVGCYNEA